VNLSDNSLNCGGCGTACGGNQVCAGGACVTLALGNGGSTGGLSGLNPIKVAVYGAASTTDLQTKLQALSAFTAVDFVNVSSTTPTLAQMKAYDAVAVYTYLTVTQAFGDNLADYFEQGGGVVIFGYETRESGTYQLKGRFDTQYTLSSPVTGYVNAKVTLGTLVEPASPLLSGVTTFALQGTLPYHVPTANYNRNNPINVALWSDGVPAVVRAQVNGRDLVEINSYGMSSQATSGGSYGWDPTTDGAKLIRNALNFVTPKATVTVTKQLNIPGQPLLTTSSAQALTYTNVSGAPLTITQLKLSGSHIGEFAATPTIGLPATIPAGGTFVVNVNFTPLGVGLRAATLTATIQNGPPATTLLTGTGI